MRYLHKLPYSRVSIKLSHASESLPKRAQCFGLRSNADNGRPLRPQGCNSERPPLFHSPPFPVTGPFPVCLCRRSVRMCFPTMSICSCSATDHPGIQHYEIHDGLLYPWARSVGSRCSQLFAICRGRICAMCIRMGMGTILGFS